MTTTDIDLEAFKKAGFTYEEIESIKKWERDIKEWKLISKEEMNNFIQNELFSKYKINA